MEQFAEGVKYPRDLLNDINEWWLLHREYDVNEHENYVEVVKRSAEQIAKDRISMLKAELEKIKEDIEQETFGLVRDDFAAKKARAAEIINELRVLEGKQPREIKEAV